MGGLGKEGNKEALLYPSKHGYRPDSKGLECDLIVAKLRF